MCVSNPPLQCCHSDLSVRGLCLHVLEGARTDLCPMWNEQLIPTCSKNSCSHKSLLIPPPPPHLIVYSSDFLSCQQTLWIIIKRDKWVKKCSACSHFMAVVCVCVCVNTQFLKISIINIYCLQTSYNFIRLVLMFRFVISIHSELCIWSRNFGQSCILAFRTVCWHSALLFFSFSF